MSYFSIKTFIEDGKTSLKEKHYWSALSVALILPSMCSRIEFKDNPDYKKGHDDWKDRKCYEDFCEKIFKDDKYIQEGLGDKYYEVLYSLRCDIAHAGVANIYNDNKKIFLADERNISLSKYWVISIKDLCESIFDECECWLANNNKDKCKETRFFDTRNENDDRLLLDRLCERDRADYLEEEFLKEEATNEN